MSIEQALAELAAVAPKDVLAGIMVGTGLWDEFALFDGPTEPLYVAWSHRGVTACVPVSALGDDEFTSRHPRPATQATSIPRRIERPLRNALATGRLGNLPVDLSALGEFQRAVLEKCAQIPPGEIRPYGWIAKEIGKPDAVRAVGTALGRNPLPILIPCHRVVRTDGHIGNYAFGTQMKWDLLEAEGVDPLQIEAAARRRVRYTGSDTTHIYCYPTCRHAKTVVDSHRVEFRSADEARSDGYRPCKVCRPAA